MRLFQCLLIVVMCLGSFSKASATHIVGGEMSYKCLGNNQYEITLTVFRDCFYGVPFFDNPAAIGVFDANNVLVANFLIPYMSDDTIVPILSGDCFILPPNACVHTASYRTIATLPPLPGGYTLAYQRCCRNQTILNIVDPNSTGATFSIFVSEQALAECNSSPVFKEWPPIYICVAEPIFFDHSAIDTEGDSIAYRLCTPLDGATFNNPLPQPPFNPPYNEIVWNDPPYNLDNVMGGVPLAIDPFSGLLTGIPSTIGQFVVGICADEFRDGNLISSTRRDFQYNVGICGQTVASFFVPDVNCRFDVKFNNLSANADQFIWFFDLENDLTATSTEYSPTYTYPDSGNYVIMLIAQPDDPCVDTFYYNIRVERPSIKADFNFFFPSCDDSLTLAVTDLSSDSLSTIVSWNWRVSLGSIRVLSSQDQNPVFRLDTTGVWVVRLIVTAENGCRDTLSKIFSMRLPILSWQDTTFYICQGDTISINPNPVPNLNYTWLPNIFLSNNKASNPLAFPDSTITYTLLVTSMNGLCKTEREVTVVVSPPLALIPPNDTVICTTPFQALAITNRPSNVFWYADPANQLLLSDQNPAFINLDSSQWIYVVADDDSGCIAADSFFITYLGLKVDLPDTILLCPGESFQLEATPHNASDTIVDITWQPEIFFPLGNTTNPVVLQAATSGTFSIFVMVTNQNGCPYLDSMTVIVLDTIPNAGYLDYTLCNNFKVQFDLLAPGAQFYIWDFGDGSTSSPPISGSPVSHQFPGPGPYTISVSVGSIGGCQDTLFFNIDLPLESTIMDFDWAYITCSDTAIIQLTDLSTLIGTELIDRIWIVDGIEVSQDSILDWIIYNSELIDISLVIKTSNGCIDTLSKNFSIPLIELELSDTVFVCPGDSIQLNPDGSKAYNYQWMPGEGLSDSLSTSPWITPLQSTLYTAVVTDTSNSFCAAELSVWVGLLQFPDLDLPMDITTCDSLVLLTVSSNSVVQVEWAKNLLFNPLDHIGDAFLTNANGEQIYYFRVKDVQGCIYIDSVRVSGGFINLDLPDSIALCFDDTLTLTALFSGYLDGLDVFWQGDGPFQINEPPFSIVVLPGSGSFMINLEVSNQLGCTKSASSFIAARDSLIKVDALADPIFILPGGSTILSTDGRPGWSYEWFPPDHLEDPSAASTLAFPMDSITTYYVFVTDEAGCRGLDSVLVLFASQICDDPHIFVPNTFTPNGDGLNDILFARGPFIDEMLFIIYNRWGNEVFQTRDKRIGWDGTYKGVPLSSDVFGYYLEVKCHDGETFTKRGNVTLLQN